MSSTMTRAERDHERYLQHRGEVIARSARWAAQNPEKRAEIVRRDAARRRAIRRDARLTPEERAAVNLVRNRMKVRRWAREHPARRRAYGRVAQANRRARVQANGGSVSLRDWQARWDYYAGKCWMCGDLASEMDHVIPLTLGGPSWPSNLRPACRSCNASKGGGRPCI
jgi:5-methylcytosine-specific restriction endonuclease McrA